MLNGASPHWFNQGTKVGKNISPHPFPSPKERDPAAQTSQQSPLQSPPFPPPWGEIEGASSPL